MACPDCFRGVLSKQQFTGTTTTLHGFPTYVARPEGTPKGVVVILPDAFGWELVNTRILADAVANEAGYIVYLPDLFNGWGPGAKYMLIMDKVILPQGFFGTLIKPFWVIRALVRFIPFLLMNPHYKVKARALEFFRGIRGHPETSALKIGAAAYCFTAPTMAHLASDPEGESLVDAVFTAHPSMVTGKDFENVKRPVSISIGDKDMATDFKTVKEIEGVLKKRSEEVPSEVVVIPNAIHGFGIRGDWDDPEQKANGQGALKQMLDWFAKYL